MATTAERIKEGMSIRNLKQVDIIEKTGINKGALSSYIAGTYEPKQRNIYKIALALDVNEAWLMGYDVSMERMNEEMQEYKEKLKNYADKWNIQFNEKKLISNYRKLNSIGKDEALKRIEELTFITKYTETEEKIIPMVAEDSNDDNELNAACEIKGSSEEDRKHDDDIMDDPDF